MVRPSRSERMPGLAIPPHSPRITNYAIAGLMLIAAASFAALDGFDRERPAMAVRRSQNRGLKIGAQIVPQHGWLVGLVAVGRRDPEEVLKAMRLRGIKKAEDAALILAKAAARQRSQQARDNWV